MKYIHCDERGASAAQARSHNGPHAHLPTGWLRVDIQRMRGQFLALLNGCELCSLACLQHRVERLANDEQEAAA